ncbi:MAG: hypothetical protein ABI699_19575 [Caldimonas sp.]
MELWPRHPAIWMARFSLFNYTGRGSRALAMLGAAESRPPLPPGLNGMLRAVATALATGVEADRRDARDVVLNALDAGGPLVALGATMDLAALGETALALDVTEASCRLPACPASAQRGFHPSTCRCRFCT